VKTLPLILIALVALATASVAAPLVDASSRPDTPRVGAIPVAQDTQQNSGEVTEVIPAGKYTYLHVTQDGKGTWLAIPRREVTVGTEIQYGQGAVMTDFHSNSLNRTFEEVLFLGGVMAAGETPLAAPPGHPPVPADPSARDNLPNVGQVSETIPAGSYTYLHVTQGGEEAWLAIPRRDVPVGAEIRYADGAPMTDFHSPSLNRTFEEVLFLGGVMVMSE